MGKDAANVQRERNRWLTNEARNKTRNITKSIWAMLAAAPAMPVKPNNPATRAMIKNIKVQPSI